MPYLVTTIERPWPGTEANWANSAVAPESAKANESLNLIPSPSGSPRLTWHGDQFDLVAFCQLYQQVSCSTGVLNGDVKFSGWPKRDSPFRRLHRDLSGRRNIYCLEQLN